MDAGMIGETTGRIAVYVGALLLGAFFFKKVFIRSDSKEKDEVDNNGL